MKVYKDQMGETVTLPALPQRIVSLVPSQTELLFDLGLADRVVGVTRFCVHPKEASLKTSIGGTKKFNLPRIASLQPDLIIGNKEENYREGIVLLQQHYPVWMSDIVTLEDALEMILEVGQMTQTSERARALAQQISDALSSLPRFHLTALYLIWKKPWMAAGGNTFINTMLLSIGLHNVVADQSRYPQITEEEIIRLAPDVILLSSEPYPFSDADVQKLRERIPRSKVVLVDGEMFSWYGSRLLKAAAYLKQLKF